MLELTRISLRQEPPLIRLLHVKLIALLLRETDSIVLRLEVEVGRLHEIPGGLPSHELSPLASYSIPEHAVQRVMPGQ